MCSHNRLTSDDILYWIKHEPRFGKQAVFLDDANVPGERAQTCSRAAEATQQQGIKIVAPPMWVLLTVENGKIVPSQYAQER